MAGDRMVKVAEVVREIEAEVARRRAAGEYPEELLAQLRAELTTAADQEPAEVLATIQTVRPIRSGRPLIGRIIVNSKRALRRLMSWYVQPMAEDQTRFNRALLTDVRELERRLSRVETPWRELRDGGVSVAAARATALVRALAEAPPGPVAVLGAGAELRAALREPSRAAPPAVVEAAATMATISNPLDQLERAPARSLAAVLLAGILPRLAAAELLGIAAAAARTLREGGLLVIDAPDPLHPQAPGDPSSVDPAMLRWLAPDTALLLCEAAGLTAHRLQDPDPPSGWYTVVAGRSR